MVTLCPPSFENRERAGHGGHRSDVFFPTRIAKLFPKGFDGRFGFPLAESELDRVLRLLHVFRIRGQRDGDFRHLVLFGQLGGLLRLLRCFRFRGGAKLGSRLFYSAIALGDFRRALKTNRYEKLAAQSRRLSQA